MLLGEVEVLEDQNSKDMPCEQGDTQYHPQRPTDPDDCILKFTAKRGCCYSSFQSVSFTA